MKKKLIILLTVVMCVGLLSAGCSSDNSDDAYETEYEEETDADDEDLYSSKKLIVNQYRGIKYGVNKVSGVWRRDKR